MPRVQNPELRDAFDVWQEAGKACKTTRCRYCGETRSGNSSRQLKHLRSECPNYRNANNRLRNETAPQNGAPPTTPGTPGSAAAAAAGLPVMQTHADLFAGGFGADGNGAVPATPLPMPGSASQAMGNGGQAPPSSATAAGGAEGAHAAAHGFAPHAHHRPALPSASPSVRRASVALAPPPAPPAPLPPVPTIATKRLALYTMSVYEDSDYNPNDPEEKRALLSALASYYLYRRTAHRNLTHRRRSAYHALPQKHQFLLSSPPISYLSTLNRLDEAIESNALLAEAIFRAAVQAFDIKTEDLHGQEWLKLATGEDVDKVKSTLKQFCRDWSEEGAEERRVAYGPVLDTLRARFPVEEDRWKVRVLVPGAGLARLAFEICLAGFETEGNEFSFHQLMASNYILNHTQSANQHLLHPFINSFSNHRSRADHLRVCPIPDVYPALLLAPPPPPPSPAVGDPDPEAPAAPPMPCERFSMSAGDFCQIYSRASAASTFQVVATVFFIDTAPNLFLYLETIHHVLQPGGLWINFGPLLWHYEDRPATDGREMGVELTLDEVLAAAHLCGFRILERRQGEDGLYTGNRRSMLKHAYQGEFWVAEKMASPPPPPPGVGGLGVGVDELGTGLTQVLAADTLT